jgi:chromate transporter
MSAGWVFGLFFKIGLVMYGGGYVLIAFLQQDLVDRQHLLTNQQLLDAVSISQITPGPLFTTATFIGYLLAGHGGAIAGTVGIFLPGFLLVALLRPWLDRVQDALWVKGFLAGINPAAWGLMAVVVGQLGLGLSSWPLRLAAIGSFLLLLKWPNISWGLMLSGAIAGYFFHN